MGWVCVAYDEMVIGIWKTKRTLGSWNGTGTNEPTSAAIMYDYL